MSRTCPGERQVFRQGMVGVGCTQGDADREVPRSEVQEASRGMKSMRQSCADLRHSERFPGNSRAR